MSRDPHEADSDSHPPIPMAELHDATLVSVRIDWESGVTHASFRTIKGTATVCFCDTVEVFVPRKSEWGQSVSVLEYRSPSTNEHIFSMQSGDEIRIVATLQSIVDRALE